MPSHRKVSKFAQALRTALAATLAALLVAACGGSGAGEDPPATADAPQAAAQAQLTVSWTPPTVNDDGSPLTDLAGYRLYYGHAPGTYSRSVVVADAGAVSHRFDSMPAGSYFVIVKSFNSVGVESNASTEAHATIP